MTKGFAYIDDQGVIDIETVCSTEFGAKVNAIVAATHGKVLPTNGWDLSDVEAAFLNLTGGVGRITAVIVSEAASQDV